MEGTPHLFWALTSLGGGVGFLGVGIAVRSLMVNGFFLSRPPATKPVPKDASPVQQAPSPEQSRLEGRNQILESSHWVLQQELLELRGKMAEQGAQVARETALRMHLEVALGWMVGGATICPPSPRTSMPGANPLALLWMVRPSAGHR